MSIISSGRPEDPAETAEWERDKEDAPEEITLVSLAAALEHFRERLDAIEERLNPPKRDPASTTDGRFERGPAARWSRPGTPRRVHPFGIGKEIHD